MGGTANGSVPKSMHKEDIWPLDGFVVPEGKSALAEIYAATFSRRNSRENRKPDQQDAYAVARWLAEMDQHDLLQHYLATQLTPKQKLLTSLEGWILGIM